jgi:hypothetical protein
MSTKNLCLCGELKEKRSSNCNKCEFASRKENPRRKAIDIKGQVFNNWTALERVVGIVNTTWLCRCKCGTERNVQVGTLRNGLSKSCGCESRTRRIADKDVRRLRIIWGGMKSRCENSNQLVYKHYGARGIKVEWMNADDFCADMLGSYKEHLVHHSELNTTIDRIDTNGNYSKNNCKWSTRREQAMNRNTTRISKSLIPESIENFSKWCKDNDVSRTRAMHRLSIGWSFEKAVSKDLFYAKGTKKIN